MQIIRVVLLYCLFLTTLFSDSIDLTQEEKNYLEEKKVLKIQSLDAFPPFNFIEDDTPQGYSIDYLKHIGKILDVKVEFVQSKSWNDSLQMFKNGEIDIIPHIAVSEKRKKFISFTNFIHIEYLTGIATNRKTNIKTITDLHDHVLGVSKNSFIHKYFLKNYPNQKLYLTDSSLNSLTLLAEGKVDAIIGSLPVLNYYIQKNWLTNIKTVKLVDIDLPMRTKMPMGVSKKNKILKSILEKAHNDISFRDDLKLKQKWLEFENTQINNIKFTQDEKSYLKKKKRIKMCIDPDWMPFEENLDGKHIGMTADYMTHFENVLNIPIEMVPTKTWLESLHYGKERKCDIFSLVMSTPERKQYLDFTKPYMNVPLVIATKMYEPFINDIPSVVDKPIGIVKGYAYSELLKIKYPNMNIIDVENVQNGLELVYDGKIFGFIGTLSSVGYRIQKHYIGELKIAGKFDETWDLGIGIRNDEPLLKSIFEKAIDTITTEQTQTILNKWISIKFQKVIDYRYLWELSIIFVVILLVVLYKNRAMNKLNKKILLAHKEIQEQHKMVNKYVLMLSTDIHGNITHINEAYSKLIGYTNDELCGEKHHLIHSPKMSKQVLKKIWKSISKDKSWIGEVLNKTKNGEEIVLNMSIEPIFKDDKKIGYRSICENITDKKRIEVLSITDKLTGLYNRMKLDDEILMKYEEFKRYKIDCSIILIDIDDFKKVNDNHGHDVGDYILRTISQLLKEHLRVTDIIGRWGGEEFVIVCENTDLESTYTLAENLRKIIQKHPFEIVGRKTISLGIAQFKEGDSVSSLFKRTDEALYRAKNSGKNCVVKEI